MLDIKLLRNKPEWVYSQLLRRNFQFDQEKWSALESNRKKLQTDVETLQAKRNQISEKVSKAGKNNENVKPLFAQSKSINTQLVKKNSELKNLQEKIHFFLLNIPNIPDKNCPDGKDESHNQVEKTVGMPPKFDFKIRDHIQLGQLHQGLNLEQATRISSSRFMVLEGMWAKLHRILIQFMLEHHIQKGYQEVYVPYLVNEQSLIGTGQLPKFSDELFHVTKGNESKEQYYLIPTAEVPVTNLLKNQIIPSEKMPYRFVCHSPCFRSEAGSYGKDTKGIIRQHQFEKVELVQIAPKEQADQILLEITEHAQHILKLLELPYRTLNLCAGDLGFSSQKTTDIEVWIPSQQQYREISSCSSFGDFQARRLKMRFKNQHTNINEIPYTFNGSALAIGRTLVALVENHQQKDGSIVLPEVLADLMQSKCLKP